MKEKFKLVLERPARKAGGDRYQEDEGKFQMYVPQDLSRENRIPKKELWMLLGDREEDLA